MSKMMIPASRSMNPELFHLWQLIRTHTAALFFVVAGMIFSYLLLQDQNEQSFKNSRAKKGLLRGLKLFLIGFILHLDIRYLHQLKFSNYVLTIHVLQSIALTLIIIVLLYYLTVIFKRLRIEWLFVVLGVTSLMATQWVEHTDGSSFSIPIQILFGFPIGESHYSSAFPLIPWLGYGLCGAFLGALIQRKSEWLKSPKVGQYIIYLGVGLMIVPYGLFYLYDLITPSKWLKIVHAGYEFGRVGRVLVFVGLIAWLTFYRDWIKVQLQMFKSQLQNSFISFSLILLVIAFVSLIYFTELPISVLRTLHVALFICAALLAIRYIRWNYALFIKLGQQTLPIYIIHVVILYGGFIGIGLDTYFAKDLHPWEAIIGASLFITFIVFFIKYLDHLPILKRILK